MADNAFSRVTWRVSQSSIPHCVCGDRDSRRGLTSVTCAYMKLYQTCQIMTIFYFLAERDGLCCPEKPLGSEEGTTTYVGSKAAGKRTSYRTPTVSGSRGSPGLTSEGAASYLQTPHPPCGPQPQIGPNVRDSEGPQSGPEKGKANSMNACVPNSKIRLDPISYSPAVSAVFIT